MRKKKHHEEEHVDETWLIPYSDMMTLLLALFIVMFAMSKVDQDKFKSISRGFNSVFSGGNGIMDGSGSPASIEEIVTNETMEENQMNDVKSMIEEEITSSGYGDKVKVDLNSAGLNIIIQDAVLFNSGDASILKDVEPLLNQVAKSLKTLNNEIEIVGHTDNVPIKNSKYDSNLDLSSSRAINVLNYMVSVGGLNPSHMSTRAYGEYKPKYDNSTEEGKTKNRRVEIFVVRNYPVDNDKSTTTKN
ncbi:flagellar motor protein MotB [Clostridium intestinale]|uniref:flagellar motor protein MotB n=1 Tax=Clostridium intestinale TaxID=36845 RepID=UPI002DD66190|nr:flagellar motor protein MotB [Clostridium intestinale]WRY52094.1 flagellar motor protein MotB [Clostridium intestinale]